MGNTAALFLFVLAGAFIFAYRCHYFGYLASRMEGRQLVFLVTGIAVGLLLLSRLCLLLAPLILPESASSYIRQVWEAVIAPFGFPDLLGTFFGAFLLGPVLAFLVNRLYGAEKASTNVIERYAGEREKLLFAAMEEEALISVTLASRKVYIGWPVYTPDLRRETRDFRLLPALSGYRDEKTLKLEFTTQYMDVYQRLSEGLIPSLSADDFEIVIPLEDIASVSLFSLEIDQNLFKMPSAEAGESREQADGTQED